MKLLKIAITYILNPGFTYVNFCVRRGVRLELTITLLTFELFSVLRRFIARSRRSKVIYKS